MIAGVKRVPGEYVRGIPVSAIIEGEPHKSDLWNGSRVFNSGGSHMFELQDLRVMSRMRLTGVSYADVAYIFGVTTTEAKRFVRLYVGETLGIGLRLLEQLPPGLSLASGS